MSVIWRLADSLGTVPREADAVMRRQARAWWNLPRTFACPHAKPSPLWLVVWPLPSAWCGECGPRALEEVSLCSYCGLHVEPEDGDHVIHEPPDGFLVFLSSAHHSCLKEVPHADA